jgi:hypothetical protein
MNRCPEVWGSLYIPQPSPLTHLPNPPILDPIPSPAMLLPSSSLLLPIAFASTVLIPKTVFGTTASLEQYFTYNYPWGSNTHNGTAPPLPSP